MSSRLVEETFCDVFTTGYNAATDDNHVFSISIVESVVKEMIYRDALDETLNQNFYR